MLRNLQKLLFYSIILFLPTQLGKHFWPAFSYVSGIRVDYLSPTPYFTDVLIILLFFLWVFKNLNIKNSLKIKNLKLKIILFTLFLVVGIFLSKSPMAGWYGLIKLLEFGFFGWYTAFYIKQKKDLNVIILLFAVGICFESFLAIVQFINQASIGGIFYFLGERTFFLSTPGIAITSLQGHLVLRPYGTFSHPNVLAGYLIIVLTMIISNYKFLISNQIINLKKYFFIFSLLVGSIALFLTMSRVAIILWVVILFVFTFKNLNIKNSLKIKNYKLKIFTGTIFFVAIIFISSPLHFRFTNLSLADESMVVRERLLQASVAMVKKSPLLGVGINNFLPNLPLVLKPTNESLFSYLQPVHNIFFIVASETGIIGLGIFLWFIGKTYKRFTIYDLRFMIFSTVLILGLFDHYFLTLQQGQLLMTFVFGLCWSKLKV